MSPMSSLASVGADVSRTQAVVAQASTLKDQPAAPNGGNTLRAASELLQRVLAMPDTGHDLDVMA